MNGAPVAGGAESVVGLSGSNGTSLTAGASSTYGASWTQLVASTGQHADGITVHIQNLSTAGTDYAVDIAFGGAGSEVIVLSKLLASNGTGATSKACSYFFPIQVPSGTRISAKVVSSGGANLLTVAVSLHSVLPGCAEPYQRVDTYGVVGGGGTKPTGVTIDPGRTVSTEGAWVAVGTVTQPAEGIVLGTHNITTTSRNANEDWLLDVQVAYGGGSADILTDYHMEASTSDDLLYPMVIPFLPCHIPAGGTINARAMSNGTALANSTCIFGLGAYLVS